MDEETEDVFETLVFQAGARMSCGCTIHDGLPLTWVRYKTAAEAREGHMACCRIAALGGLEWGLGGLEESEER